MPKSLKPEQLKKLKTMLLEERERVASEIRSIMREASQTREDSGENKAGIHMADMASDAVSRELSLNIASTEQNMLYSIDDALKRIEEGNYGVCEPCGKAIPVSRLKAMPHALYCIECQTELEQNGHIKGYETD